MSRAVKDTKRTILSKHMKSAVWYVLNICKHLIMTLPSLYINQWQSQSHSQIRTRCTSVCGWRSFRASSSESENLCSSSYWQVQKLSWARISSFSRRQWNTLNFCGATQNSTCFHKSEKWAAKIPWSCLWSQREAGLPDRALQEKLVQEW